MRILSIEVRFSCLPTKMNFLSNTLQLNKNLDSLPFSLSKQQFYDHP